MLPLRKDHFGFFVADKTHKHTHDLAHDTTNTLNLIGVFDLWRFQQRTNGIDSELAFGFLKMGVTSIY